MEIAVISGKGGTGKSSISAAFATIGKEVVLADCDVDAANLHILFNPINDYEEAYVGGESAIINYNLCTNCGACLNYCRFDAIALVNGKIVISETTCDGCRLCSHVCPENAISMLESGNSRMYAGSFRNGKMVYGRLAPGEENTGRLVNIVRDKAKSIAKENIIDKIVIDGPPGIGCPVISTITGVDSVVIVTEPTLSAMHDLKRTVEIANKFNIEVWALINKCDINIKMTDNIEKYCNEVKVKVAGKIPYDEEFVHAMVNCKSIIEWNPKSKTSQIIKQVFEKVSINNRFK